MKRRPELIKDSTRIQQEQRTRRETTIRIIFDADVAPLVRERVWLTSQQITPLADGRIELCGTTTSLTGLDRWVFGWGPSAHVLEPGRLRSRILKMAQTIVARG
jgi:predicted DNA-binding transcriptional regulator YafY